ncbi:MAG TPA: hypothetical protein VFP65_15960 [Anaeromyxobacteraceae bacterium]|nr:hypothetical protein [Anaeromyxobacteraceae bacterium]
MRSLVLAVMLAAPALAGATEVIALLPATGANVEGGELAAATDVLRARLEGTGRYLVVMAPPAAFETREPTVAEAVGAARASGAPVAVTLRISRLGAIGTARLAAYADTPRPTLVHVDELPLKGVDDLEPALRRLAEGMARGEPARELAQIDSVTAREADPGLYQRRTAARLFGVRLSGSFDADPGDGRGRTAMLSGLGFTWQYDARSFMADCAVDFQWSQTLDLQYHGDRDWLLMFSVGAYYPIARGDVTPYLGAALAYELGSTGAASGNGGLAVRPAAGVVLGRLSEVQVRFELGYQIDTFVERDALGQAHRGHGPVASVAVVK